MMTQTGVKCEALVYPCIDSAIAVEWMQLDKELG